MAGPFVTELSGRGVVRVAGPEAAHFLHNLVTCDVEHLEDGAGGYGALLTPQGKIIVDFFVGRSGEAFLLDLPAGHVAETVKRLTVYKLRSKVTIEDVSAETSVLVFLDLDAAPTLPGPAFPDPRLPALGLRAIVPSAVAKGTFGLSHIVRTDEGAYHRRRIAHGVPESGADFALGEVFPHDVDMDQLNGVDFRKGCYVGQEVVSRMQHRGTARRRMVIAETTGDLPAAGTALSAGGRPVGTLGSASGSRGLALVRLDRAIAAMGDGEAILADDVAVTLRIPEWASFTWPAAGADAG